MSPLDRVGRVVPPSPDPQEQEVRALVARTVAGRAQLRDRTGHIARLLDHVTEQLANHDGSAEERETLLARQRHLWGLRQEHARGMRQVAFTIGEIADALGVSLSMARKIIARPGTSPPSRGGA